MHIFFILLFVDSIVGYCGFRSYIVGVDFIKVVVVVVVVVAITLVLML